MQFKLGLIINPVAGLGGSVALKGSDGAQTAAKAIELGAQPKANSRTKAALEILLPYKEQLVIYTVNGEMGEQTAKALGFNVEVVYNTDAVTTPDDTESAAQVLKNADVDLVLFAGGDGTARNICHAIEDTVPVLGIPAGCKIHSGVYAITPKAAGRVVEMLVKGELVTLADADVMDIDEDAFRKGTVKAKRFGEMQIPSEVRYVQAVKSGGKESDELVLQDIAANVIEEMNDHDDRQFIIGSGSTTAFLMNELALDNTLLGVDIVSEQSLVASDVTEAELYKAITDYHGLSKLVITLIGGQGHVFGRGNQQLSPRILRTILAQSGGSENIVILATKAKLEALNNKPLISDTGDALLDLSLIHI